MNIVFDNQANTEQVVFVERNVNFQYLYIEDDEDTIVEYEVVFEEVQ